MRQIITTVVVTLFILHSPFFIHNFAAHAATVQLPRTGQTTSYLAADDGATKRGVASPTPRFSDNSNGTVTDNLTGLIWLKNANCTETVGGKTPSSSGLFWIDALTWSNNLASGKCGLTDSSSAGQWRLPNINELESLVDAEKYSPALPTGHPFTAVSSDYWSSTKGNYFGGNAWSVSLYTGYLNNSNSENSYYVWPVRSGQPGSFVNLIISKAGSGTGAVSSNTGTITWAGSSGTASYTSGTAVTLTATADSGSSFASWSGCDSSSGTSCSVTMSAAKSITATFSDSSPPTISAFSLPATATSATVNISSLTATDNVAITNWCLSETNSSSACSWTTTKPTQYTFTGLTQGQATSKTLYVFAKDGVGLISAGFQSNSSTIALADSTPPTISAFTLPGTATSATVNISSLTATDNVAVTNWCLSETNSSGGCSWVATKPASYTFTGIPDGIATAKTLYAFARDAALNISASASSITTITLPDVTKPNISAFSLPATATSLTVTISTMTATDNVAVSTWCLTESNDSSTCSWTATKPTSYPFTATGNRTLYAFAKDAAGNTSTSASSTTAITLPDSTKPTVTITNPKDGVTVNKILSITATAEDNVAVAAVEFLVNLNDGGLNYYLDDTQTLIPSETPIWLPGVKQTTYWYFSTSKTVWSTGSSYTIKARSKDTAGLYSDTAVITVPFGTSQSNAPPSISEGNSITVPISKNSTPTAFNLTLHANDANGDVVTWSVLTPASHGAAAASGSGTSIAVTYSPTTDYTGSDSFVVQASDGKGGTATLTVNVSITAPQAATVTINTIPASTYSSGVVVYGTLTATQSGTPLAARNVYLSLTPPPPAGILAEIPATTSSSGVFSFTLNLATPLDRAGDWKATITFKNDPDYTTASQSATIRINKAETALTVAPNAPSISPSGNLIVSGKLTATLANAVTLADLPIDITMTDSNGKTYTINAKTTDDAGRYSVSFNQFNNVTGNWRIDANFAGTDNLNGIAAGQQTINVAAANGYAIFIQGDLNGGGRPSYTASMQRIHKQFTDRFITADNIWFLSPEGTSRTNVDATVSKAAIQDAITGWAYNIISSKGDAPLYIVMLDHGGQNGKFYISDDNNYLSPEELNGWLNILEGNLKTSAGITLKTVIINGSCYSGSFIPVLKKTGRTIITSSAADTTAAQGPKASPKAVDQTTLGDSFIHAFIDNLSGNTNLPLVEAFKKAADAMPWANVQSPLFIDNATGNGRPYQQLADSDGKESWNVSFGLSRAASLIEWKEIMPAATATLGGDPPVIYVTTSGDISGATDSVWAEVKKPSFVMPSTGTGQVNLDLPQLNGRYIQNNARWEFPLDLNPDITSKIFNEAGTYSIVFYAADSSGEQLPPMKATVYINDSTNQAPSAPVLSEPIQNAEQREPLILFRWSEASDPDNTSPLTYTLIIRADVNGASGGELKRYEQIAQNETWLDANNEKKRDGNPLFSNGGYWWQVSAVDGKGGSATTEPRKFTYTPQSALVALITGKVLDQNGSGIPSANINIGSGNVVTAANGAFQIAAPGGTSYTVSASKQGYSKANQAVTTASGKVTTVYLSLAALATKPGDCDGNGTVTITEVQSAINMFLGLMPVEACVNVDGVSGVSIAEVQKVINSFLGL